MASEPNNASANAEAEDRLKQYAAERRQRIPASMHQATRNILQGEVRRAYGANDRDRRTRIRLRWFQALAWLIIFAAIPLFLIPRHPDIPSRNAVPSNANDVNLPSANAPGAAPIVLSDTKEPVHPVVNEPQAAAKQLAAPAPVFAPVAPPSQTKEKDSLARGVPASVPTREMPTPVKSRAREELKPAPASRAVAQPRDLAVAESIKKAEASAGIPGASAAANTLNFANTVPNQMILNNFKLEQTGARLKLVDQDGSVFAGGVLTQQAGNDIFNVAGYSRTLNKATVITGQVVRANLATLGRQQQPQDQPPAQSAVAAAGGNLQAAQNSRAFTFSNNSADTSNAAINNNSAYLNNSDNVRVQGNAIIGNTHYKLDAQSAPGQ